MNRSLSQQRPEFSEVRNCVSCFSRELAVPPSKLVLLFNAAFCRRDQSLSYWRETRFLERAMGIEPNADCLEATECTSFLLSPLEHFGTQPRLLSRRLPRAHALQRVTTPPD